jgi:hypothetical protein
MDIKSKFTRSAALLLRRGEGRVRGDGTSRALDHIEEAPLGLVDLFSCEETYVIHHGIATD